MAFYLEHTRTIEKAAIGGWQEVLGAAHDARDHRLGIEADAKGSGRREARHRTRGQCNDQCVVEACT